MMNHEEFSRRGGKAGTGESKVRGDSEHYSELVNMRHRKRALSGKVKGNAHQRRVQKRAGRSAELKNGGVK